jgi:hypothetical protein
MNKINIIVGLLLCVPLWVRLDRTGKDWFWDAIYVASTIMGILTIYSNI